MGRVHASGERKPTDVVKRMKHLRALTVEFEYGNCWDDSGADLILLEALQPHQNIESLDIKNYSGSRFPSWLMVENFGFFLPKLVTLIIRGGHKCQKLPLLWQLPSLQRLELWDLELVENTDGVEEGDDDKVMLPSSPPTDERYFPSLKQLYLWKVSQKILRLILCPPHHSSPICNLNKLTLVNIEDLATMPEDVFKSVTSVQSLYIRSCLNLAYLPACLSHLTSFESLCVEDCPLLELSNDEALQFDVCGNLSIFSVHRLDKLTTLPAWLQHFSSTLKSIRIWKCRNFTTIPEWIGELTALQDLSIERCTSSLKQRCEKEAGEDWPKIAHIPNVKIY